MRKIITFFIACLLLTVAAHAQTAKPDLKAALQLKLDEWHKAGSFPGATLGVVLADGESFGLAVGFSDRETKRAMTPTDRMLAGSVGKTFAAATALQLIKEGKISLDDKIEKYLSSEPWFKAFSPDLLPQVLDGVSAPMLGREAKYGLGVMIRKTRAGTSYGHSGFFPGYMTDMMYFPEHKVAIAVQVNTSVGPSLGKPLGRVLVEMMEIIATK